MYCTCDTKLIWDRIPGMLFFLSREPVMWQGNCPGSQASTRRIPQMLHSSGICSVSVSRSDVLYTRSHLWLKDHFWRPFQANNPKPQMVLPKGHGERETKKSYFLLSYEWKTEYEKCFACFSLVSTHADVMNAHFLIGERMKRMQSISNIHFGLSTKEVSDDSGTLSPKDG